MTRPPGRILPTIILSQFAGTSLWFAANAVLPDLQRRWGLSQESLGDITAAVQLGFIAGTLAFAVLALSDRIPPEGSSWRAPFSAGLPTPLPTSAAQA